MGIYIILLVSSGNLRLKPTKPLTLIRSATDNRLNHSGSWLKLKVKNRHMIHLPTVSTFPLERNRSIHHNPQFVYLDAGPEGVPPIFSILVHPESTFDEQLHHILLRISWC